MFRTAECVSPSIQLTLWLFWGKFLSMICSKCKEDLPESKFYKSSRYFKNPRVNKKRLSTVCKQCVYARINANRNRNPEKHREMHRRWALKNRDKISKRQREWRKTPKGIYRNLLKRSDKVVISREDFVKWINSQGKFCGYCGVSESRG